MPPILDPLENCSTDGLCPVPFLFSGTGGGFAEAGGQGSGLHQGSSILLALLGCAWLLMRMYYKVKKNVSTTGNRRRNLTEAIAGCWHLRRELRRFVRSTRRHWRLRARLTFRDRAIASSNW